MHRPVQPLYHAEWSNPRHVQQVPHEVPDVSLRWPTTATKAVVDRPFTDMSLWPGRTTATRSSPMNSHESSATDSPSNSVTTVRVIQSWILETLSSSTLNCCFL
jgi:hypothetical protein